MMALKGFENMFQGSHVLTLLRWHYRGHWRLGSHALQCLQAQARHCHFQGKGKGLTLSQKNQLLDVPELASSRNDDINHSLDFPIVNVHIAVLLLLLFLFRIFIIPILISSQW